MYRVLSRESFFLAQRKTQVVPEEIKLDSEGEVSEQHRIAIHESHIELIKIVQLYQRDEILARIRQLKTLQDPASSRAEEKKQGLPAADGKNLFLAILHHPLLEESKQHGTANQQKAYLLSFLHDHLYKKYYTALIEPEVITIFVTDDHFNRLMKRIYLHALRNNSVRLSRDFEQKIWDKLLLMSPTNALEIFKTMIHAQTNVEKTLQFIVLWADKINNQTDVLVVFKAIEKAAFNADFLYLSEVKKIIKQRLLRIELDLTVNNRKLLAENKAVENFLSEHRSFALGRTASKKIYTKIHNVDIQAEQDFKEENTKFENEVNKKLTKQTARETQFHMDYKR
jgi:hypothetical protein